MLPARCRSRTLDELPRLNDLIRDGKLYISLQDAIALALENNLDLAIARYNLPIADTDIQRTKAGGSFRGVNTGVVQGTPGGGVGGFGAGAPGAELAVRRAVRVARAPAHPAWCSRRWAPEPTCRRTIRFSRGTTQSGALDSRRWRTCRSMVFRHCRPNTGIVDFNYTQAFPTGTSFSLEVDNDRQTTNSIFNSLNPTLNSYYRFTVQQQLLAGFGSGRTCAICGSRRTTRRSPTSPSRCR